MKWAMFVFGGVICACCTALAEVTLASADNAAAQGRQAIEDGLPTAPEKYRRPKGWKPSAPYPKTHPAELAKSPLPFALVCQMPSK